MLISFCYCVALKNLTPDWQVSRLWLPIFQNFLFTCPWSLVLLGSDSFSPRILSWDRVWSVSSEDSTTTTHHGLLLSPASEVVYIWALLRWHRLLCSQQLPVCCRGSPEYCCFLCRLPCRQCYSAGLGTPESLLASPCRLVCSKYLL